jgi:hypothetical protein
VSRAGIWIAVAMLFVYLVARPHIGTVYYVSTVHAHLGAGKPSIGNSTALARSLLAPAAAAGATSTFVVERDCDAAAAAFDTENHAEDAYCASRTALLWGWAR